MLNKVTPTTLIVTEVTAPEGYSLDSRPQTVVIQPGDTQTLRFYDDPLCTLTLFKRDAKTLVGLMGATIYVRYGDGRAIGPNNGRYVTDSAGRIMVYAAPGSTVVAQEVSTVKGYALNAEKQMIQVGTTSAATPQVYNATPATAASAQHNNSMTFYEELCCKGWWLSLPNTT